MALYVVIEDDAYNARYIADGFRELGHSPVVCRDGLEGLTRAPSAIVLASGSLLARQPPACSSK